MKPYSELSELQLEQQRHDEIAHRDILSLGKQDRVKHMVLHFAKYSGHFASTSESRDDSRFIATLVDTFIICLACANALNLKLNELVAEVDRSLIDFGPSTVEQPVELSGVLFSRFAKVVGTMAKACESLDHFEKFDYHGTLERGLAAIALLCLSVARKSRIDLYRLTRTRWAKVEAKFASSSGSPKNDSIRLANRRD